MRYRFPKQNGYSEVYPGSETSSEAVAFGAAMDRYKRLNHRPFPTLSEVLEVARSLGYRKTTGDATTPARATDATP